MKNTIFIFLIFITILTIFGFCTSKDELPEKRYFNKKVSTECKTVVDNYDSEIIKGMEGRLIVKGNEPFTKLVFETSKEKENYAIVKECSKELWKYQGVKLIIDGKIKISELVFVTGQKAKQLTLYPISITKVKP